MKRVEQGFSLFECLIAGCLILIIATGTYSRYQSLAIEAEQAAFKGMVSWLNAGINLTLSDAYSRGKLEEIDELHSTNPLQLLQPLMTVPSNYLGEISTESASQAPPAHWYYDLDQRRLVYHVRYTENLDGLLVANQRIYFQLKVRHPLTLNEQTIAGRLQLVADDSDLWQSPLGFGRPPQQTVNDYEIAQLSKSNAL